MKLPKIPIDYSKAGSGEAPFDGEHVLLHYIDKGVHTGGYKLERDHVLGEVYGYFSTGRSLEGAIYPMQPLGEALSRAIHSGGLPTHYTPMPEFVEQKELIPELQNQQSALDQFIKELEQNSLRDFLVFQLSKAQRSEKDDSYTNGWIAALEHVVHKIGDLSIWEEIRQKES